MYNENKTKQTNFIKHIIPKKKDQITSKKKTIRLYNR